MAHNEILVAGMHMANNQFTRFVSEYGYRVIHRPDAESDRQVPFTAGAVICTGQISHEFRHKVVDFYKEHNLPFLETRSDSTVEIKERFEKFFVEPIQKTIEHMNLEDQLLYVLLFFNKLGTKIHSTNSVEKSQIYIPRITKQSSPAAFVKFHKRGIIEAVEGTGSKGLWRLVGLNQEEFDLLQQRAKTLLPKEWLKEERQEFPVEQPQEKPIEETQKQYMTELETRLAKEMQDFKGTVGVQISTLVKAVERMALSVNKDSKEALLLEINSELNAMPVHELLKIKTMLDIWKK